MHARAGWASTVPGADPEASTVPCLSCGCEGPGRSGDDRKFALENKAAAAVGAFAAAQTAADTFAYLSEGGCGLGHDRSSIRRYCQARGMGQTYPGYYGVDTGMDLDQVVFIPRGPCAAGRLVRAGQGVLVEIERHVFGGDATGTVVEGP